MKSIVIFASVLALAFAAVVDLTPDNFDTVVDGSKGVFVEFFCTMVWTLQTSCTRI
jgi:hypothetical protein